MAVLDGDVTGEGRTNKGFLAKVLLLLFAGTAGTVAFAIFGQGLSPLFGGSSVAPVPLAGSVYQTLIGERSAPMAQLLHYFAGIVCYPVAFALIGRPLWNKFAPWMPWLVVAVAFGAIQWVFAVYVMAHLVAGMAPFLGWSGITYSAFYGHIIYAIVAIGTTQYLRLSFKD